MEKDKKRLLDLTARIPGKKVAVWGDIILDEYVYGTTRRVSREAPVLIISFQNTDYALGGAGNAILNIKALGAEPVPVGILGNDEAADRVVQILKSHDISTKHLIRDRDFQTPQKTRILAGEATARKQQVLRIDRESRAPETSFIQQKLLNSMVSLKDSVNALIISDYHYFVVNTNLFCRILPVYRESGIPVSLDSRFRILDFPGITITTPNESEVEEALGIHFEEEDISIHTAGSELLEKTQASAVLITRGSKGMSLFEWNQPAFDIPIHGTSDIVDVTGAGDTVISVITLALACDASFKEAARLANHAGGNVVMKKGTATLTNEELRKAIES